MDKIRIDQIKQIYRVSEDKTGTRRKWQTLAEFASLEQAKAFADCYKN